MKKNKLIFTLFIFIPIISIIFFLFLLISFSKKHYSTVNPFGENIKIPIPALTYQKEIILNKEHYITTTFYTLKSVKSVNNFIDNYTKTLSPCAEDFFQDIKFNTTIYYYYVENEFPLNKITIIYGDNPTCNGSCINYEDSNCYEEYYKNVKYK